MYPNNQKWCIVWGNNKVLLRKITGTGIEERKEREENKLMKL